MNEKWTLHPYGLGVYYRVHRRDGCIYVVGVEGVDYDTLPRFCTVDAAMASRAGRRVVREYRQVSKPVRKVKLSKIVKPVPAVKGGLLSMSDEDIRRARAEVLVPVKVSVEDSNH